MYEATPQPAKNPTGCPDCGALLSPGYPKKYGWGTMSVWSCGRTIDDGPGADCPKKLSRQDDAFESLLAAPAEPVTKPMAALAVVEVPNELAEVEKIRDGINRYMGADLEQEAQALLASTAGITVAGHAGGPKAGREAVHSALMRLVKFRTQMIESAHQSYKAPIHALAKLLDGRKSDLLRMTADREAALKADRDAYDKAETERKAAEAADKARKEREAAEAAAAETKRILQERAQRLVDLGATPNVVEIAAATDEQFEAMVVTAAEAQALLIAQQEADRIERQRLAEVQRKRTELIESRTGEALRAGIVPFWSSLGHLADIDDDEFRALLCEAIEAKALADQEAEAARLENEKRDAELERLRKEAAERAEADRIAQDARDKDARDEAERVRAEAERPDREKATAWLDALEFELCLQAPALESVELRGYLDGHKTILLRAVKAAKVDFA